MKRAFNPQEPELMDLSQPSSPELERDLANLASLNRWFGSHRLVTHFLELWFEKGESYRVLDLATGAGDIPRLIVDWARQRGIAVEVEAVDANPGTLDIARAASAGYPEITWVQGNVLAHESGRTHDLVCCSLALHHFDELDAIRLLLRARELSHRWVLVSDLERGPATSLGVWLLTEFIYRDPMTRYDGRLSARRAFSFAEMSAMAEAAGWTDFCHSRCLWCRQAIWMNSREVGGILVPLPVVEPLPCPG